MSLAQSSPPLSCSTDAGSQVSAAQMPGPLPSSWTRPQWGSDPTMRAHPPVLWTFHLLCSFAQGTFAFSDDLFDAERDLEIEFPATWEANSHLSHPGCGEGELGSMRGREMQM